MMKELKTDYCILGGGIAGILLASQLVSSGKKITIIDQGPRFSEEDRANLLMKSRKEINDFADYNDDVDPSIITPLSSETAKDDVIDWTNYRLFGLGGTALHFQGIMMRPTEEDMKVRSLFGYGRDWPISYADLEPWLLKAEYEIGVAANEDNPYTSHRSGSFPMPGHPPSYFDSEFFAPGLKKMGMAGHSCPISVNSVPYRGRSGCLACRACKFCPSGARYSPDRVHIPILEKHENVEIIENLSVRRLETNQEGNKIVAAHALRIQDKSEVTILANNFIVAMGGVETARMLLLSADNHHHKDGLGNIGGQLGRGFSDHLSPYVTYDLGKPIGNRLGFETMTSDHFRTNVDRNEHPTFALFSSPAMDWFLIGNEATMWSSKNNRLSLDELRERIPRMATLVSYGIENVNTGSMLELDKDTLDAFGDPVAKITFKLTDWDMQGYHKFTEVATKLGEAMGAKDISEASPPGANVGYHPSGATAMAKNPDEGVCDENLKVFGLKNLHIVSNSVFPHMGASVPTLTISALALRLADHLKGIK